jgi:lysophospholipase L1-like esterase
MGDSICYGIPSNSNSKGWAYYFLLDYSDKFDTTIAPENVKNSNYVKENLKKWLGNKKYDFIVFNCGLHDIKWGKVQTNRRAVEPDEYEKNLREIVDILLQTKAKIIWCTTTPIPEKTERRKKEDVALYNEIAKKVMDEKGIKICDLNQFVEELLSTKGNGAKISLGNGDVHFTNYAYKKMAAKVAETIEKESPGKSLFE